MIEKIGNMFFTCVMAYIIFGVLLYLMQRSFLYFPTKAIKHNLKEIIFNNEDESIKVTVLNTGKSKAIMYFGGNGENVDYNAVSFSTIFPGHTVYLIKYRGYGGSTGKPEEKGIYSDALFIFDKIKLEHTDISVIGRSLGTGVATLLASKRDINKLVLITPFDSIQSIAQAQYPVYPISLMLKDKYDSISRVKSIKAQTLALIAENDQIINKKHSIRLVNEFPSSQITVEIISNAGHNNISDNEKYFSLLRQFL